MTPPARSGFDLDVARALKELQHKQLGGLPGPHEGSLDGYPEPPTLTIGLATYDDFDGAYFTVSSAILQHPHASARCEFLILDNNPAGPAGPVLRDFAVDISFPSVRYVPYTETRSTAVRDVIFSLARTPWVLVLDSHVLLAPGALDTLLAYIDSDPDSANLLQGPIVRPNGEVAATHMEPVFRDSMFGTWATDQRIEDPDCAPFEIPMHGLGLFAMARDRWPGINPRFVGFGGEEGYLHEKVRRRGGVTLCLPGLRWHHRFLRPHGVPYPMDYSHRVNNYLVGWRELGWDTAILHRSFAAAVGDTTYATLRTTVEHRLDHPGTVFDGVCAASDDDRIAPWRNFLAEVQSQDLPAHRVSAPRGDDQWWRRCVAAAGELAGRRRWRSILLLDEDVQPTPALFYQLRSAAADPEPFLVQIDGTPRGLAVPPDAGRGVDAIVLPDHPERVVSITPGPSMIAEERLQAAWVLNPAAELGSWESFYETWAGFGLGTRMHRLAALTEADQTLWQGYGFAEALGLAVASCSGPVLLTRTRAAVSADAGSVLQAALTDLDRTEWDLLSLSTPVAALTSPITATVSAATRVQADALVVHPRAWSRLREALPPTGLQHLQAWDEWVRRSTDLSTWLDGEIGLVHYATRPEVVRAEENWRPVPPEHAGRMRRH